MGVRARIVFAECVMASSVSKVQSEGTGMLLLSLEPRWVPFLCRTYCQMSVCKERGLYGFIHYFTYKAVKTSMCGACRLSIHFSRGRADFPHVLHRYAACFVTCMPGLQHACFGWHLHKMNPTRSSYIPSPCPAHNLYAAGLLWVASLSSG